ncbi:MAG: M23 family peptidase, partial [Actinobacteria bacterium]|nr:M23 family peptidase [Actinomycetota bacterium]
MNHANIEDVRREPGQTPLARRARSPRRGRRNAAALSITAIGALVLGLFLGTPAAYADDYPSWDDVQAAKANEAATATEVSRIQGLIASLTQNVADTKAAAEAAGNEAFAAQQAANAQARRTDDLQAQADTQKKTADDAASKAGQIAAQLSRDGGDTTALQLFFSKSTANKDELLQKLGQMDRVLSGTQAIYDKALEAKNTAQSLTDQATKARAERDRLSQVAQDKLKAAQVAAAAAQAALTEQQSHL